MQIKKKVQFEREVVDHTICDKCGRVFKEVENGGIVSSRYEHRTGSISEFGEGGFGEMLGMDLCEDCAESLHELLKASGYKLNQSDWEQS
jgi:protein-arginine kinase activator protein McsA